MAVPGKRITVPAVSQNNGIKGNSMNKSLKYALIPAAALIMAACSTDSTAPAAEGSLNKHVSPDVGTEPRDNEKSDGYLLEILHLNDIHSYIDPAPVSLRTEEGLVRIKAGGPEALKYIIDEKRRRNPDAVLVSDGDQITGNASNYDLFHGEADAVLHGMLKTDYYMLGNHEFDHGGKGIAEYLGYMKKFSPQSILINSDLTVGKNSPVTDTGVTYDIRKINGRNVAFYAVTTESKIRKSSSPDSDMKFKPTVSIINALTAKNRGKADIHVLLSHQGIISDRLNAAKFNDIDVIIGGDSHSLCGDFSAGGIRGECVYPMTRTNATGHRTCVVQAYEYGKVIGDLKVIFDEKGNVTACKGSPIMPLWQDTAILKGDDVTAQMQHDAEKRIKEIINDPFNPFTQAHTDDEMTKALEPYRNRIRMNFRYLGKATQDLCTTRYPTDNCLIKSIPNPYGSETCRAFGAMYLDGTGADIYLANSGMYRTDLEKGDFTDLELLAISPFNNYINEIELTGKEFSEILNRTMEFVNRNRTGRDGGVPCGYGFSYAIDNRKSRPVTDVRIVTPVGKSVPITPDGTYKVLVSDYLLRGKDGYRGLKGKEVIKNYGNDAEIVRKYLKKHEIIPVIPRDMKTITSFTDK